MGYMRRHAIVVTSNRKSIEKAHAKALEIFERDDSLPEEPGVPPGMTWKGEHGRGMVSSIVSGVMNEDVSFFIGPDGSKEGWAHSYEGDRRRKEFIDWLRVEAEAYGAAGGFDRCYCYWAEVYYGDDDGRAAIVGHSAE